MDDKRFTMGVLDMAYVLVAPNLATDGIDVLCDYSRSEEGRDLMEGSTGEDPLVVADEHGVSIEDVRTAARPTCLAWMFSRSWKWHWLVRCVMPIKTPTGGCMINLWTIASFCAEAWSPTGSATPSSAPTC